MKIRRELPALLASGARWVGRRKEARLAQRTAHRPCVLERKLGANAEARVHSLRAPVARFTCSRIDRVRVHRKEHRVASEQRGTSMTEVGETLAGRMAVKLLFRFGFPRARPAQTRPQGLTGQDPMVPLGLCYRQPGRGAGSWGLWPGSGPITSNQPGPRLGVGLGPPNRGPCGNPAPDAASNPHITSR